MNSQVVSRLHGEDGGTGSAGGGSRPLIAVTTSELRAAPSVRLTLQGEPAQTEMALGMKYLLAIEAAGGIPLVVPPLSVEALEPLLAQVAGICLSGGPDLDPIAYGAGRHKLIGPTWSDLDKFELAVARAADARRMPILAICRGLQVLNVARGGTLYQHLPDLGDAINHRQVRPGPETTHSVSVESSSRLGQILGVGCAEVNSFHHQAVSALGEGLVVSARSGDGTIEGIEAVDREFLIGVQWHAECLVDRPEQAALFGAFVRAAQGWDDARSTLARVA